MSTMLSRFGLPSLGLLPKLLFHGSFDSGSVRREGLIEATIQRAVQRRQLLELDDGQLLDMGISKAEAYREANKPFWRA